MIIDKRQLWRADSDGQVRIKIGFLETGHRWRRDEVKDMAEKWEDACPCISFKWPSDFEYCDVRISFNGDMSCSEIGISARDDYDGDHPTMSLDYTSDGPLRRRHILHEFGHMLGARHEHCSPNFPWEFEDKEVIKFYEKDVRSKHSSWSPKKVKDEANAQAYNNVLKKLNEKHLIYSDFDDKSIMLYPMKANWLKDNPDDPAPEDLKNNYHLSSDDRKYMRKAYHGRVSRPDLPDPWPQPLQPAPYIPPGPVAYPGGGVYGGMPDWWQARWGPKLN